MTGHVANSRISNLIPIGAIRRLMAVGLRVGTRGVRLSGQLLRRSHSGSTKKSVLILEPFGMGDVIHLEPLTRTLHEAGWQVKFCGKTEWTGVLPPGHVTEWIPAALPWTSYQEARKYWLAQYCDERVRACLKRLRHAAKGAVGIDPRGDLRNIFLLHWMGCHKVVTLERYLGTDLRVGRGVADYVARDNDTLRRWEVSLGLLQGLDDPAFEQPKVIAPPDLRHLLPPGCQRTNENVIGLAPMAPWPGRLWSRANWQALIEKLRGIGCRIIGLCGPNQASDTRSLLGIHVDVLEARSVAEWAANFMQCRLAVVLDSGPLHLADAVGLPLVGLYGAGKLPLWAPSGPRSIALHHQDAPDFYPLHQITPNVLRGELYMSRIKVGEVFAAIEQLS